MRILQVGSVDLGGGAERVAWDLLEGLRRRGHVAKLAVGRKRGSDPDVIEIPNDAARGAIPGALLRIARRIGSEGSSGFGRGAGRALAGLSQPGRAMDRLLGREDFDHPGTRALLNAPEFAADLVHAHNLHGGYFDLRVLPELWRRRPVAITLHDAWLLSGHCAHSLGCERWRLGCGQCPDLTLYPAVTRDATAFNFARKRAILAGSGLHVAAPSRWLLERAGQSILAPATIEGRVIPNGVDTAAFRPGDRAEARRALGLPERGDLLLVAAHRLLTNPFKDYPLLERALERLGARHAAGAICVALGDTGETRRLGSVELRFVPHVADRETLARWYRAAELFVHPSRADTFPLAVLESLASGTPVVATAVGGIPEQILGERTGCLVPLGDDDALAECLARLLADPERRSAMGGAAREDALARFGLQRMVDAYLAWYREILESKARTP